MGAIHVQVELTNAIDAALARRGQLPDGEVRCYSGRALVDTGAIRSVIPVHVLESLGLQTWGKRVAEYADGRQEAVGGSEPLVFRLLGRETVEEALVLGDEILVGQTVLEKLDLLADCANRQVVPNPAHPDQPVSTVK